MNKIALIAFFDESEKIAMDSGVAMEGLGIPVALWEGHSKGGLKGMATAGLGALGGMGAGMLATHYVKKLTGGQWGSQHPILKTIAEAAPIGMGGVIGSALGSHFAGPHKVAGVADVLLSRLAKSAPIAVHEKMNMDAVPERYRRVMLAIENNIPVGSVPLP